MSIRYVAAVLDNLAELSATETLVLVALADYASDDTRQCWPSLATISRRARCDRRTVQRTLRKLERDGLIETAAGGQIGNKNVANSYRLKFDYAGQIVPDAEPKLSTGGRHTTAPGAAYDPGGGGIRPPRGRHTTAPSVIRSVIDPKSGKPQTKEAAARAAAALSDAELEELASNGKLTAAQEYEREHRRRFRRAAP